MIGESQNIQSSVLSNRLEDDAPNPSSFSEYFLTCPSCYRIPSIKLLKSDPNNISLQCSCGFNHVLSLREYLSNVKSNNNDGCFCQNLPAHKNIEGTQFCMDCGIWFCGECSVYHDKKYIAHHSIKSKINLEDICTIHKGGKVCFYCRSCNKHLCPDCYPTHKDHALVDILQLKSKVKIQDINDIFIKAVVQVKNTNKDLKERIVNLLFEQIDTLERTFTENQIMNENIIELVNTMITNFHACKSPNYFVISNLLTHSNFNFKICEIRKETFIKGPTKAIDYFKQNTILNIRDKYEEISLKKIILIYTIKEESSYDYSRKILLLKDGRLATVSQATDIKIYGANVKFPLEILKCTSKCN